MVDLTLTEEQVQLLDHPGEFVRVVAPDGRVIGSLEPFAMTNDLLDKIKERVARHQSEPGYTGAQVRARMEALQRHKERVGDFDEAGVREFLQRMDELDPPFFPPPTSNDE